MCNPSDNNKSITAEECIGKEESEKNTVLSEDNFEDNKTMLIRRLVAG